MYLLQPVVVYKAIRERAHGARLEKSLLLPFNIITVGLTERQATVGELWGQTPEGKIVCASVQFINRGPSMWRTTSCARKKENAQHAMVSLHHLNRLLAVCCCPSAVQSKHYSRRQLLLFVCGVVVLPPA